MEHGHTSPKLSALAYQYLFDALFRSFIICAVKVDSAEQVTMSIQDVDAIVWHWHSLDWLLNRRTLRQKCCFRPADYPRTGTGRMSFYSKDWQESECVKRPVQVEIVPMGCLSQASE